MEVRVDKYLFAMRLYKTRSIAADACKNGRVTMNGTTLKSSRTLKVGDRFSLRKGPITYTDGANFAHDWLLPMGVTAVPDAPPRRTAETYSPSCQTTIPTTTTKTLMILMI